LTAFALACGLFVFLTIVGRATLLAVVPEASSTRRMLLAPPTGLA
jgi:hypothetical protein